MNLTDIVVQESIVPNLQSTERDEVLTHLVDRLIEAGAADASIKGELIERLLERERKGSTGFGRGVAVPHVKHKKITRMAAAIGLSEHGIEFNALDKQPVFSVVLLLSPEDKPEEHLQAMEAIFKNLSKDTFRRFLRQAGSVEDVTTLLDEADHQKLGG